METVQSPIIPIVGELVRHNPGTISLGQGVVFYPPPPGIMAGISQFLENPKNHQYKSVQGMPPLLESIKTKLQQENGIEVERGKAIVVTAGGNMAFMNAILAITSAGDEIILNTPYYFNHEMAIRMADCSPILVKTDSKYQLCSDAIASAITSKTRAVVTISPNNPTGAVYPESALRTVNKICQEKGIYHIHDEAYEYFTYDGVKHFSPASLSESSQHTISLYSLSKAYGFASWRIGYMVIPEHLLSPVKKIQDTILICPPVISQYAAWNALQAGASYCQKYLPTIAENRRKIMTALQSIEDIVSVPKSAGAFYFFLKIKSEINDFESVKTLIEKYRVALLPGVTFGMTDGCYLRLAYGALETATAAAGIERLVRGLKTL
jgi:aspartate/methionine/tyrosine aminotransferase